MLYCNRLLLPLALSMKSEYFPALCLSQILYPNHQCSLVKVEAFMLLLVQLRQPAQEKPSVAMFGELGPQSDIFL